MNHNYTNNSHNNNTNIQNNITNNIQLIGFGKERILEHLTKKDKRCILNSHNLCLEKLIELTNCGPYNQFKNIIITNVKDNFVYKYDESQGYFVIANKNDTINSLVETHMLDLEEIYNKLSEANKIDQYTKDKINKFFEQYQNENKKFKDSHENITYSNYKDYKINKIKILLYNNQDKITKDLALYFMPEENESLTI